MNQQDFIKAGFSVIEAKNNKENKLLSFLKENYPSIIKANEIDLTELKAIAGLPVDEKVNGYGLNFVGRNFARAKYAQKTEKELQFNTALSKDIDTTQNLVLIGDNLDTLKILKNHYRGKIKCIYIDPPYNTASDEFIYPDKFNKEETEVLGIADSLSEYDFARMEFSFKSKKNHNGWLSFMYPRLLLARDLLSEDGVIFISIDDNELANLKLLCDDVFGEENFVANLIWESKYTVSNDAKWVSGQHEYVLCYAKNINDFSIGRLNRTEEQNKSYKNPDNDPKGAWKATPLHAKSGTEKSKYEITFDNGITWTCPQGRYPRYNKDRLLELYKEGALYFNKNGGVDRKTYLSEVSEKGVVVGSIMYYDRAGHTHGNNEELAGLVEKGTFDNPKGTKLIKYLAQIANINSNHIILDFFAGSGTTGHAVMELNKEDGGNRKYILCQIDEPIKKDKPAYKFCIENNLDTVISSITIERLRRAGEKIVKETEETNSKNGMFEEDKKQVPDIGFKVFDSVDAPKLEVKDYNVEIQNKNLDALSRIYNMIFTVGIDEPTQVPEEVIKDCIYKIDKNYYITNCDKINSDSLSDVIKSNNKVFIDGWTASINCTLQHYKDNIKIVY